MKALISEYDAADILAISVHKLRKMVREKRIPFVEIGQHEIRFDERDLAEWVSSRRRPETLAGIAQGSF